MVLQSCYCELLSYWGFEFCYGYKTFHFNDAYFVSRIQKFIFFFGIQKFMKNSSDQALFREQKNLIDVRHQVIFEVV